MHLSSTRNVILVAVVVVIAAILLSPLAKSQMQASPSYIPIGVSAAGSSSIAWFHEPFSRQALACQAVVTGAGLSSIQCVTTKLP